MTASERTRRATIQDVAVAAGVTKATVSYTFSGKRQVTPRTRAAVLEAARTLGYEPNPLAQRLSNGHCSNLIGFFCGHLEWSAGTRKLQIIQDSLAREGFDVPVYISSPGEGSDGVMQAALLKNLSRQRPRAIVCTGSALAPEVRAELHSFLREGGVVVNYDRAIDLDCDSVVFDREHNTCQTTRHLLELGHRRVGFYNNGGFPEGPRLAGFRRALTEFGVPLREEWLFHGQYEDGGAAMAEAFLRLRERPSAVCMVNDYAATAFIATVQRGGVRVPEDVSVVSHADMPIARHGGTPLTTMTHPIEGIARQVVDLVMSRLNGGYAGPSREVIVRGELVRRQSACRPAQAP